ncbi:MAG: GNAT family N-acetyltransferase [Eggerthellaceae bacterium]|jgi:L-amino acid N-acyltransferase YncA
MAKTPISLRAATAADAPRIRAIYEPYVRETAITFEYTVPDVREFADRISRTRETYPYLVAEDPGTGKMLGYAYAGPFSARRAYDWAVETSIYVRRDVRGKGTGRALYAALERVLRAQGFVAMYACIAYPPDGVEDVYLTGASVAFHEHLGFHVAGTFRRCACKFGRWYDMVWMERSIAPRVPQQPDAVPFPQMADALPRLLNGE